MRAAGPGRTLFTSPRWDCPFWVLTWLKRHWLSPERRPPTVGPRLSSPADAFQLNRLGRILRQCWTAACSTPSKATSERDTWQV